MALRAVLDHPKFADLQGRLKRPRYVALGCLEALWHFAGRYTAQGNIGKYSDQAIETWVGWDGESGALIEALVGSGWLDKSDCYRLLVHDWAQHADKATKNALKRAGLDFCTDAVRTEVSSCGTASRLPEPVPEPVPEPESGTGRQPIPLKLEISRCEPEPPEGLHELNYGRRFWDDLGIFPESKDIQIAGGNIKLLARDEQCTMVEAMKRCVSRATEYKRRTGKAVNRWFFTDGHHRTSSSPLSERERFKASLEQ